MPEATLSVRLVSCTPSPEALCALAARTCYSAEDADALLARVKERDQSDFLGGILASGHLSVLEHASFTFAVSGVSRALLAQLTRHRIASFSVQSQRYVSLEDSFSYVVPERVKALGEDAESEYRRQMDTMRGWYRDWMDKLGKGGGEDARYVLPAACETKLVMTMNVRELLHFFSLRCCSRAQWEIRHMANEMLALCKREAPKLFDQAGPGCVRGACPEGKKTCGRAAETRAYYQEMTVDKHGVL